MAFTLVWASGRCVKSLRATCGQTGYNEWVGMPLDDRFHESCHKRGIHLSSQTPISAVGGLETKDEKEWQRGGGRLKCRLEMRTSRT